MAERQIIKRYLTPDNFERAKRDLSRLVKLIRESGEEYNLQLREKYFNIYYQGNSLAKVIPNKNRTYLAEIHKKFVLDEQGKILKGLEPYISESPPNGKTGNYMRFRINPQNLHQFFQRNNINALSSRIRLVHNGEEITFEQVLITDNPPSRNLIIIDRQVADHVSRAQIDLLALRRDSEHAPFHFLVIEVKLGKNRELYEKVGKQLNRYVIHIRKNLEDYVTCYKENYRQKKELGLFPDDLPSDIEIDENKDTVKGLVVVCGYSGLADQAIINLKGKIRDNQWDIEIKQIKSNLY